MAGSFSNVKAVFALSSAFYLPVASQQAQIPPAFHLGTITTVQDNQVGISISDFSYETFDLRIEEIRVGDPVYLLRQELGDILTVLAHIDFGETACKEVEVRAGCIVMSGKDGKLLVLPWQSREGRELPDAIQLKRTEKALEMKEIKRKVVADDCFLLSSCSVTGTTEEFTASFLSLKPQSQSDITTTEGKKEEIGAELGLSLVSIEESQAIREFKQDFPVNTL